MKVFAVRLNETGHPELVEVGHDLGIRVHHNGQNYTVSVDNSGHLVIRSINAVQMIVKPKGSNSIEIEGLQ